MTEEKPPPAASGGGGKRAVSESKQHSNSTLGHGLSRRELTPDDLAEALSLILRISDDELVWGLWFSYQLEAAYVASTAASRLIDAITPLERWSASEGGGRGSLTHRAAHEDGRVAEEGPS